MNCGSRWERNDKVEVTNEKLPETIETAPKVKGASWEAGTRGQSGVPGFEGETVDRWSIVDIFRAFSTFNADRAGDDSLGANDSQAAFWTSSKAKVKDPQSVRTGGEFRDW